MTSHPQLLATRTLNAIRKLHLPTYIATRYLFDSVAGQLESTWSLQVPKRKYPLRIVPRFHLAQRFKSLNESDGTIVYRDFQVPSPATALAETVVLQEIAPSPSFGKKRNVYSYRWPIENAYPYNFEHYSRSYRQRNVDIQLCLQERKGWITLVSDIERFYPSIDQSILTKRFQLALEGANITVETKTTAMQLLDDILLKDSGGLGIATGPELSHVAGDLALKRVDEELTKRFSKTYFRYVDDIVLVVEADIADEALEYLVDLLRTEGLIAHPNKTEKISAAEWLQFGPHIHQKVKEVSFEALVFQIKTFLLLRPEQKQQLERMLGQEGFAIPIRE